MFNNQEKAVAVFEIHTMKGDCAGIRMIKLLDILVGEARLDNDTISAVELAKNQGKIEAWLQLKDYIERGSPAMVIK